MTKSGFRASELKNQPRGNDESLWWVYLVECRDGSLYCGISNDVDRRVKAHNAGRGARYTRSRGQVKLVWRMLIGTRSKAMRVESKLKKLPRSTKLRLAAGEIMLHPLNLLGEAA